jgi:tetratricopeptide (TPR) repeat protein
MRQRYVAAFIVAVAIATPVAARAEDAPAPAPATSASNAAQAHYTVGRESYRLALYGRALEAFERSLALAPSPNTRLYIARSLRELGRWAEASDQYAATVREAEQRGGRYLATRGAANGGPVGDAGNAGNAAADAAPSPGSAAPTDAHAPAGPAADGEASHRGPTTLTWVSGGVAVAGAVTFTVLYGLAGNRFGYLQDNCARVRTSSCDDARTTGKTEEVVAYSALGVAVVAGALAVYSLVRSPSSAPSTSSSPSTAAGAAGPSPRKVAWPLAF